MNKINLLFAVFILLFSGCAEDGEVGPQGPAGNANVRSHTFTVNSWEWTNFGTSGQPGHCRWHEKAFSDITQNVFDNGTVLAYYQEGSYWNALPTTVYVSGASYNFQPLYRPGYFEVDVFLSNLQTPQITGPFNFKIVVIDGNYREMAPELNWNDYNAVAEKYNLPLD